MANPVKGEAPLKLADGREFKLVLDMEAMIEAEEVSDRPLPEIMQRAQKGYMGAIATITQAAFLRNHPAIERSDIIAMLQTDQEAVTAAMMQAAKSAFPEPEEEDEGNGKTPPRGKRSGRSGAKRG